MRTVERVFRIVVASAVTGIFTTWSVYLFESQPSEVPTVQVPKCPTNPPDQACLGHALKVALSGSGVDHWSLWVVWVFWALIAVVWLAACALILWSPRPRGRTDGVAHEPQPDDTLNSRADGRVSGPSREGHRHARSSGPGVPLRGRH